MTGFLQQFVYTSHNTHHTKVLIVEYLRPAPAGAAVLLSIVLNLVHVYRLQLMLLNLVHL